MERKRNKKILPRISLILASICFVFSSLFAPTQAKAMIPTIDAGTISGILGLTSEELGELTWTQLWENLMRALKKAGSAALQGAIRTTLKQIAFDTATFLASGGDGQDTVFFKEGMGSFLGNVADTAAGNFIENFGRNWGENGINLCEPDFDIKLTIGLGLTQYARPKQPECTWSEMKKSWSNEFERMKALDSDDFLEKLGDMFDPTSNSLGVSWSLQLGYAENVAREVGNMEKEREEGDGWAEFFGVSRERKWAPSQAEIELSGDYGATVDSITTFTGDALVDAINVFMNQFMITLIKTQLRNLTQGTDSITSPYTGDFGGFRDYEYGPVTGGISGAEEAFQSIIEPNRVSVGDYAKVTDLQLCNNPNNPGPTECVIDGDGLFKEAIESKMTLDEAIEKGKINPRGIFGFINSKLQPEVKDMSYPYRSLKILRKYRIIPATWELAAQYIRDHSQEVGVCSIGDILDCYENIPGDKYDNYKSERCITGDWCLGLVDPDWVFKAPENYCKRQGAGPLILSAETFGTGDNSEVSIYRDDSYCADEQSCILEEDGKCQKYGYCMEERRIWDFGAKSCEPRYNTCQTFTATDQSGRTVSYLENTLEYCSSGSGCEAYCHDYDFFGETWGCTDTKASTTYFNSNVEECESDSEGCHEYIRTKAGLGANLLKNSDFEEGLDKWSGLVGGGSNVSAVEDVINYNNSGTTTVLALDHAGNYTSIAFNPDNENYIGMSQAIENIDPGQEISISYWASTTVSNTNAAGSVIERYGAWLNVFAQDDSGNYLDDEVSGEHYFEAAVIKDPIRADGTWEYFSFTIITPPNTDKLIIQPRVQADVAGNYVAYFDDIKVEKGDTSTTYGDYRAQGLAYLKLLPDYLKSECFEGLDNDSDPEIDTYIPKPDAPIECDNYVRECAEDEVGCDLYTSQTDGTQVPAKITGLDACEASCVGYDTYVQKATPYDISNPYDFIPATAKGCDANSLGCEEFTNLDKLGSGAEEREYYTQLKKCRKPDNMCDEFYTWEGSEESGFQIRVHQLEIYGQGNSDTATGTDCADDYNAATTSPDYNPDCREFYNQAGGTFYRLFSSIIECTDNCHPYRLTDTGLTMTDTICEQQLEHKGTWDADTDSCIFMAIPGEGQTCSAEEVGCREYAGNQGNANRIIYTENFESMNTGWSGGTWSSEAVIVGTHAYRIDSNNDIELNVSNLVSKNKAYTLSFLAKKSGGGNQTLNIYFLNTATTSASSSFVDTMVGSDWALIKTSLDSLDHDLSLDNEVLVIEGGASDVYIDDIRLTEIQDKYYLIKNSWNTPDECDEDIYGNFSPGHDLGCDHYQNIDGIDRYLHNFTELCPESAAGCELMIDTHNYSSYEGGIWNDDGIGGGNSANGACEAGEYNCVEVPADNYAYIAYNPNKTCSQSEKGCQYFGKIYKYGAEMLFDDVYFRNNPDRYDDILCIEDQVGCKTWNHEGGPSIFKDPGDQACEWREEGGSYNWYKVKIKRCNGDGDPCMNDSHCTKPEECIVETTAAQPCGTPSNLETIGIGGMGNVVYQPVLDNWAAYCPASQSGCTEYIDPVSDFMPNEIFNPTFTDLNSDKIKGDGWEGNRLEVKIEPFTLYTLKIRNTDNSIPATGMATVTDCTTNNAILLTNALSKLDYSDNKFDTGESELATDAQNKSVLFYTNSPDIASCVIVGGSISKKVILSKVAIDYQIEQKVNNSDDLECNSTVNRAQGCVLFNVREINNGSYASLNANADKTQDGKWPSSATTYNANQIIKVSPDRTCNKWLACKSIVKDDNDNDYCFDIGLCDALDANNNCSNFYISDLNPSNLTYEKGDQGFDNLSGYVKVGYEGSSFDIKNEKTPLDQYNLGNMSQVGEMIYIPNSSFEITDESGYPNGWYSDTLWRPDIFKTISSPSLAEEKGACFRRNKSSKKCMIFTPDGESFLEIGAKHEAKSDFIDVIQGEYTITGYVNTNRLFSGKGRIKVVNSDDVTEADLLDEPLLVPQGGDNWTYKVGRFTATATVKSIKIILKAESVGGEPVNGNVFFDQIQIRPALEVSDYNGSIWRVPQTCRLYPNTNSLACDYYNDAGIRQKGWPGYCLDYDVSPGSSEACLLWYPIDKVKGDAMEEGAGYGDKTPLYFCVEARKGSTYVARAHTKLGYYNCNCTGAKPNGYCNPAGSSLVYGYGGGINNFCSETYMINCGYLSLANWQNPPIGFMQAGGLPTSSGLMWDRYDSNHPESGGDWHTRWRCVNEYYTDMYCTKIVQVVSNTGQNKAWLSRIQPGSTYEPDCNMQANTTGLNISSLDHKCGYASEDAPFGSVSPPGPVSNPYLWDSKDDTSAIEPLYYNGLTRNSTAAWKNGGEPIQYPNMGQLYDYNELKMLFAKSYGVWEWTGKVCNGGYKDGVACDADGDCISECVSVKTCQNVANNYDSKVGCNSDCDDITIDGAECNTNTNVCDGGCYQGETCSVNITLADSICQENTCERYCVGVGSNPDTRCVQDSDCPGYNQAYCDPQDLVCVGGTNNGIACGSDNDCRPYCGTSPIGEGKCWDGSNLGNFCSFDNYDCGTNISTCSSTPSGGKCLGGPLDGESCEIRDESVNGDANVSCADGTGCTCENSAINFYKGTNIECNPADPQATCDGSGEPRYQPVDKNSDPNLFWGPPENLCNGDGEARDPNAYCAVLPKVEDISITGYTDFHPILEGGGFVNLTFNSNVDDNQLPMILYAVYWGDNNQTVVSGVEMKDRPIGTDNPHTLYHQYNYWDLSNKYNMNQASSTFGNTVYCGVNGGLAKTRDGDSAINCPAGKDCCMVRPEITIKDNWGWCNSDISAGTPKIDMCSRKNCSNDATVACSSDSDCPGAGICKLSGVGEKWQEYSVCSNNYYKTCTGSADCGGNACLDKIPKYIIVTKD